MSEPSTLSDGSSSAEHTRWFTEEVHPHEGALKAYLRGAFPFVRDIEDVVQESYLRVWKTRTVQPIQAARAFLFRVARNIALDLLRRHRRSPIHVLGNAAELDVIDDRSDVAETVSANERIALLVEALGALSPRHRQILIMCKLQGKSYREVAARLALSEKTVAEHVYRGVQSLGEELQKRGVHRFGA